MNFYFFGNMLNYASLLMIASAANCLSLKNSQMNLGGEGQVYLGGFITALAVDFLCKNTALSPAAILFVSALAASSGGFLMNFLCGILKCAKNVPELLTSFLMSGALIPLIDGAISGKFRIKEGNLLATEFIGEAFRLKKWLPPSSLNATFLWGIAISALIYFFLAKTDFGRRLKIFGAAKEFALASGYSNFFWTAIPFSLTGFFHGLAGFFAVAGTHYTCHSGFYAGLGWNALNCALIAKSNPLLTIPVSLLYSFLYSAAAQTTLLGTSGFDTASLIQGSVLLVIAFVYRKKGKDIFLRENAA